MINKLQAKLRQIVGRFYKLETKQKGVCIVSVICALTVFANWYSDFDVYQNGVSYNALEGPASFNSFAICFSYLVLASNFLSERMNMAIARLELSFRQMINYQIGFVGFNFISYLSTCLHRDFGVNPNYKEFGLGFEVNILALFYLSILSFKYLQENPVQVSKYVMMDKDLTIEDVVRSNNSPDLSSQYRKQQDLANRIQEKQTLYSQQYHQDI